VKRPDRRPDRLVTEVQMFGTRSGWAEAEREARERFPSIASRGFDLAALAGAPFDVRISAETVADLAAVHVAACGGFTSAEREAARVHLAAMRATVAAAIAARGASARGAS
jgi:hypothetical protein